MNASRAAPRNPLQRLARVGPELALALIVLLGALSVWQAWTIVGHLRNDARETSRVFGRIIAALSDPNPGTEAQMLLEIARDIRATGLPIVLTDSAGRVTASANLPYGDVPPDDPRIAPFAFALDQRNLPIPGPGGTRIHYGALPLGRPLTWLALVQVALLATTIAVGVWAYRLAVTRNRDRLWVAMARESAHQLGTPLMSARAWVERLAGDPGNAEIARHLDADLDRLQRVAQRFERVGRPARAERVGLGALAERVAAYFEPRLPRHANRVDLRVEAPSAGPMVQGDPVLLEWALEALVRNSIDALSGRGGAITIRIEPGDRSAAVTVTDDGPGVPLDLRDTLFDPGVTTKAGGWGIGLALARRIVEEVHGGRLALVAGGRGATFRADLPLGRAP